MTRTRPRSEDRRRELALQVLVGADMCGISPREALVLYERAFVGPIPEPGAREASEWYRVDRFEDHLPEDGEWALALPRVEKIVADLADHHEQVDEVIASASPRWRLDRMPVVDRTLLRIGVAEMLFSDPPRARATINGLIELAKRFGSETTPAFVNGILDQIRRELGIPFS